MGAFFKVLKFAARYGRKAVRWCWTHKGLILKYGLEITNIIASIFHR